MDQKKARKLEQEMLQAIVEVDYRLGLRRIPLLPSHKTMCNRAMYFQLGAV
jgi:hypothetical protein